MNEAHELLVGTALSCFATRVSLRTSGEKGCIFNGADEVLLVPDSDAHSFGKLVKVR